VFRDALFQWQQVCIQRIGEIEDLLKDLQRIGAATKTAAIAAAAIPPDIERLSRYERQIWKSIQEALAHLNTMQEQRNNGHSIAPENDEAKQQASEADQQKLTILQEQMAPLQAEINQLNRQFWVTKEQVKANKYDLSASRYSSFP